MHLLICIMLRNLTQMGIGLCPLFYQSINQSVGLAPASSPGEGWRGGAACSMLVCTVRFLLAAENETLLPEDNRWGEREIRSGTPSPCTQISPLTDTSDERTSQSLEGLVTVCALLLSCVRAGGMRVWDRRGSLLTSHLNWSPFIVWTSTSLGEGGDRGTNTLSLTGPASSLAIGALYPS